MFTQSYLLFESKQSERQTISATIAFIIIEYLEIITLNGTANNSLSDNNLIYSLKLRLMCHWHSKLSISFVYNLEVTIIHNY